MLLIFEVKVVALGTPGPLLGDNTNTIVTALTPSDIKGPIAANDGARVSLFNQSARQDLTVAVATILSKNNNTQPVYYGARGSAKTSMAKASAVGTQLPGSPLGEGSRNDINLADLDVGADANNESLLIIAEIR